MPSHCHIRLVPFRNRDGSALCGKSPAEVRISPQYSTEGKIKEPDYFAGAQDDMLLAGKSALTGDSGGMFKGLMNIAKGAFDAHRADAKGKKNNTSPADVIQWAGCKDSQTVGSRSARERTSIDGRVPILRKRAKPPVRCLM